ncbi:MAG TPA: type II CAAX endopeptidase family protein [Candidatus Baltobacteraceae bacterium]
MENNWTSPPSAPSPTVSSRKPFPITLTVIAALGAAPVAVVPLLLYFVYLGATHQIPAHPKMDQLPVDGVLLSQILSYLPLMAYMLPIVPYLAGRSLAQLGVRTPTLRELGIGVVGAVAMWLVVAVVSAVIATLTRSHETESAVALLRELRTTPQIIAFVALAVAFAPLVEEFVFRLFLFNAIAAHSTKTIGIIASGIVFGLVHGLSATIAIPLAFGGMVLAIVYSKTNCYWSNVLTHALFNATSVVAVLVFHVAD